MLPNPPSPLEQKAQTMRAQAGISSLSSFPLSSNLTAPGRVAHAALCPASNCYAPLEGKAAVSLPGSVGSSLLGVVSGAFVSQTLENGACLSPATTCGQDLESDSVWSVGR